MKEQYIIEGANMYACMMLLCDGLESNRTNKCGYISEKIEHIYICKERKKKLES